MSVKISAVMPCFNRANKTRQAISNFLALTPQSEVELICVDDGSTDETIYTLASFGKRVKVLRHDRQRGVAPATSTGWNAAQGEVLVKIDNDVLLLRPDWWSALYETLGRFPKLGILGLPVAPIWDKHRVASPIEGTPYRIRAVSPATVNGGLMAVPRHVFEHVGYPWFPPGPPVGKGDDGEYSHRVRRAGFWTAYLTGQWTIQLPVWLEEKQYEGWKRQCKRSITREYRSRLAAIRRGQIHQPFWREIEEA